MLDISREQRHSTRQLTANADPAPPQESLGSPLPPAVVAEGSEKVEVLEPEKVDAAGSYLEADTKKTKKKTKTKSQNNTMRL